VTTAVVLAAIVSVGGALAACGGSQPVSEPDGMAPTLPSLWAREAEQYFERLAADTFDARSAFGFARYHGAGGSLDLTAWGEGVLRTPAELARGTRRLWFMDDADPERVDVDPLYVFVGTEEALVVWDARRAGDRWRFAQHFQFGPGDRIDARVYPAAVDTDQVDGATAEALVASVLAGEPTVTLAPPGPSVFVHGDGPDREVLLVVERAGACPTLEARRWLVRDDAVVVEDRYAHPPSVRRCSVANGSGWWLDPPDPPPLGIVFREVVDLGGIRLELQNAESSHLGFVSWLFERFTGAGLAVPVVDVLRFPPEPGCPVPPARASLRPGGEAPEATVVLCFEAQELRRGAPEGDGWSIVASGYGLHELAHVWMLEHVDRATEVAFTERLALPTWNGTEEHPWHERAVEHAATTIAWGLAGDAYARYAMADPPDCEELAARFQLLTGRPPRTTCPADPGG
jgi:hypothetical protein